MREWIHLFIAELKKEHRNNFHSSLIYFSLLIWPAIGFITAYYSFKPFQLDGSSPLSRFIDPDHLILFLLTGYLSYIFFWSQVQSAWRMGYERQSGTLEIIFLTPVNRLALVYGRSFSTLVEGVWLFFVFVMLTLFFVDGIAVSSFWSVPFALILLIGTAVIWGGFLNTVFLFSRDAGFLYTILDEPMSIFSGVRIPPLAFPIWGKIFSLVFPLTYTLNIMRKLVMEKAAFSEILPSLAALLVVLLVLVIATAIIIKKAEQHLKKTGNMVLF